MQDGAAGKGTAEDHKPIDPGTMERHTLLVHPLSSTVPQAVMAWLMAVMGRVWHNDCLISGHIARILFHSEDACRHVFATLRAAEAYAIAEKAVV